MPIPWDAHQISDNRVRLGSGEIVTRWHARNEGARQMGYGNERERAKFGKKDDQWFDKWSKTDQGKEVMQRARDQARAEGRKFNPKEVQMKAIAMRNARPTKSHGGGPAYVDFFTDYDMDVPDYAEY